MNGPKVTSEGGRMADVISAERANVVNGGVVKDADDRSKSLISTTSSAATERAGVLSPKAKPAGAGSGRNPSAGDKRVPLQAPEKSAAATTRTGTHDPASEEARAGRLTEKPAGKPSPTVAGAFKTGVADMAVNAATDELDETPEFEGVGSIRDASRSTKRAASRIRRATSAKSIGAHESSASAAGRKATKAKTASASKDAMAKGQAAATANEVRAAAASAGHAAAAAEHAASIATVGTAVSGAAAPIAGVIAGVLAFVLGVLIVSQLVSALFGFWENESLKDTGSLTGIEQEIAAALKGYGFSNEATAAVLGNLKAESGMDPTSDSNMDGQFNHAYERACGILQYTSTSPGTGEYWAFKQWCSANGKTWSTVEAQMEWTFSGNCDGTWSSNWSTALARSGYYSNCPGYTDGSYYAVDEFRDADDIVKATYSWMACYERPANGQYAHLDRRIEYAKDYLGKLTATTAYTGSNKIIAAAYSQIGVPYMWGGSTPGVGLDCSGLTQYCYAQAGVTIAHYTETQYEQLTKVPLTQAQPGDILYRPGHVAIFIGDDRYIHEPQAGDACKISTGIGYFSCALRYTN